MSSHTLNSAFTRRKYRERAATLPRMLDFTPDPIAFQLGPIPVYWYGIGYALGPGGGLHGHGPAGAPGRRGRRDPRQRDDHRGGRGADRRSAYHVIDQWALYQDDLLKIVLPPYSGLGVYGGIVTGTVAAFLYARCKRVPFLRWADIVAPGAVRDAGHRPLGQLLQPGAVRPADDAAVGHPDRLRPPDRRLPVRSASRSRRRASTRCSCTSRCPGVLGAIVLIWLGFHCAEAAAARRPAAALLHLVRRRPVRPRDVPRTTTGRSSGSRPRRSCRCCSSSRRS